MDSSENVDFLQLSRMSLNAGLHDTKLRKRAQSTDSRTPANGSAQGGADEQCPNGSHNTTNRWSKSELERQMSECASALTAMTARSPSPSASPAMTTLATSPRTLVAAAQPTRSQRASRSFSESSADEWHRSGEALKRAGWTQKMWRNELAVNPNSNSPQPQERKGSTTSSCCCAHTGGICCCGRGGGGFDRHRISDAIDVGIRVALVITFAILERAPAFKRKVHPEEMWLYMNPLTPDIVSISELLLSVIFGPLVVTLLQLVLTRNRRDFRAASWTWTLALGLNGLITTLLKITVGRHRPDFFYRCFPDGVAVLNNVTDLSGRADFYICNGNARTINEGRKSFPSGHASFAFVGFGFIAMYLCAKLHALTPRGRGETWRLFISFLPLVLAGLVAVSRTCDYHHHWQDVLAGSIIGLTVTYTVWRQYYPSLWSPNCHRPYVRGVASSQRQRRNSYRPLPNEDDDNGDGNWVESTHDNTYEGDFDTSACNEHRPLICDG